jgi:hypothetical protein
MASCQGKCICGVVVQERLAVIAAEGEEVVPAAGLITLEVARHGVLSGKVYMPC